MSFARIEDKTGLTNMPDLFIPPKKVDPGIMQKPIGGYIKKLLNSISNFRSSLFSLTRFFANHRSCAESKAMGMDDQTKTCTCPELLRYTCIASQAIRAKSNELSKLF